MNVNLGMSELTDVTIGDAVVFIGSNSFCGDYHDNNKIESIVLGSAVKYIGPNAFQNHYASSLIIPDSVVFIGYNAFRPNEEDSLVNIAIGKYVMFGLNNNEGAFYNNADFDVIYQNNDKKAGSYSYEDGNWSYTP